MWSAGLPGGVSCTVRAQAQPKHFAYRVTTTANQKKHGGFSSPGVGIEHILHCNSTILILLFLSWARLCMAWTRFTKLYYR
jgi:hypothetical protein